METRRDDDHHIAALRIWQELMAGDEQLVVTNYILLELHALLQRRHGMSASQLLQDTFVPVLDVHWVDRETHEAAVAAYLSANRRDLSLVDCVSFLVMRRRCLSRHRPVAQS